MADIKISYRGSAIAEINNSGTTTLTTGGYYCDSDIKIVYNRPSGGGGALETGTVTITSDTDSLTVSVSQLYNRFCVIRANDKANWTFRTPSPYRSAVFCYGDASTYTCCDTNDSGGNIYIVDRTASGNRRITFTATTITCEMLGNGRSASYPAGSVYQWFAWNE